MKKILVTTDFSVNSKAGLKFAIQLASQHKFELTFLHVYNVLKPTSWNKATYAIYEKNESKKIQSKLNSFVDTVYKSMKIKPVKKNYVINNSAYPNKSILDFASDNNFDFICLSTRGGGKLKKVFGTNTSKLITGSEIPVIAIPGNYRANKITSVLYASDLLNLQKEIKQVVDFAKPLKAEVELLHLDTPKEIMTEVKVLKVAVDKFSKYNIKLQLEKRNILETFVSEIEVAVAKSKPSILVMFTEKNRTFFQKLITPSKSEEYAFKPKVPLLVFNKYA